MASHLGSNATMSSSIPILNESDSAMLDSFIPGYSLVSRFLLSYLQIDLSIYLPFILTASVAIASLRYGVSRIIRSLKRHVTSSAEIRLDDEIYNYLMFWMARQSFSARTSHFVAGTKISSEMRYRDDYGEVSDDDDDDDDGSDDKLASFDRYWAKIIRRDKYRTLRFMPGEGTHYFWYKGRPLAFIRDREFANTGASIYAAPERMFLSCLGRDPSILKEVLAEAQRDYVARDGNRTIIYTGQKGGSSSFSWVRCMARPPRPLSTVVLSHEQKQNFINDAKEYLHPRTRRWYSNRGIPYRRGYLFHGPPGTGKTSLCFAASGLLGLKLYLISLNSQNLDEDSLISLFSDLPRRCIVLLEDVDSAGISQKRVEDGPKSESANDIIPEKGADSEDKEPKKGISLSGLLNVIDGVAASEGRILIMTTNHPEKLDPALIRPGRVDMSVEFGYSDRNSMQDLFISIYSMLEDDLRLSKINAEREKYSAAQNKHFRFSRDRITAMASDFASRIPTGEFTAAEIQGFLLMHKNEPRSAIEGVEEWVQSVQAKRKEKAQSANSNENLEKV